ncbi:MAG: SDR family oxidoreductase [Dehalococcoidia bacterium]|nr:SDR family oxidoreductase [Dehalococcoidia bacterium]
MNNTSTDVSGQVAIVTGASRGIGRAIALALAQRGCAIVAAARREPVPGTVEETVALIAAQGRRAVPVDMDVTNHDDVRRTVAAALEHFGRLDILVNNAATNWLRPVAEIDPARWEMVLRVNTLGPFLCSQAVIPHMAKLGRGHILNISSMRAVTPAAGSSAYCASKAALEALTLVLAQELAPQRICVNAIRLEGTVDTPGATVLLKKSLPREHLWPAEIMGHAAAYICSQAFPFTGQVRTIASLRLDVPAIDAILSKHPMPQGAV